MKSTIFDREKNPRMGLAVTTYGSVPYIHLQMESWRRFCQDMPLLVVDDCSDEASRLSDLCEKYGADFDSSNRRLGHFTGDLRSFVSAFEWAAARGVELLIKFSRRWIPLVKWQGRLAEMAKASQYATYSGSCPVWGFRFRTEAVAFHVPSWLKYGGLEPIREYADVGSFSVVEWVFHQAARRVFEERCEENRAYIKAHPDPHGIEFCGHWDLLGPGRNSPQADVLWHLWAEPHEYLRALRQWGINDYSLEQLAGIETTNQHLNAK